MYHKSGVKFYATSLTQRFHHQFLSLKRSILRTIHTIRHTHLKAPENHTRILYIVALSLVLSAVQLPHLKMILSVKSPGTREQQTCQVCALTGTCVSTMCVCVCVNVSVSVCAF